MSSSARRALKVLVEVGTSAQPAGVTELARRLGLAPGTVFRSLDALQRSGYTERYQASARYVLGPSALSLRQTVFTQFALRDVALPYLRQLASATGESASLIVRLGWYGLRIAAAHGSNEITSAAGPGVIGPLARHYAARPLLAFLPEPELARYQAWEKRQLPHPEPPRAAGVSKEAGLGNLLREIHANRIAREDGAAGRAGLAVPILGGDHVLASLALESPGQNAASLLRDAARAVGEIAAARPAGFADPFGHLDPDSIVLERREPVQEAKAASRERRRHVASPNKTLRAFSKVEGA